jgi:hypothetical protein
VASGRGAKVGIVLVVLLMILGGVLFVVDRIAVNAAEDQIAKETKKELVSRQIETASDPTVAIDGFPFLTQVLDGKYKKITIAIERPLISGVQLDNLQIVATTVHAEARAVLNGTGTIVADQVSGTATIGWEAVRGLLEYAGVPTAIDPAKVELKVNNNEIQLRVPLSVNGVNFAVTAKGTLAVDSGKVRVKLTEVGSDAGSAPQVVQNLIKQYQDRLSVTIRIPAMPYRMVVNKVESSADGLLIIATAANVELAAAG